jgi:sec-independent protein translocase protein TatC
MGHDFRPDPDDPFAGSRMPLGEHIEELRTRLLRAILGFLAAMVVGFLVSQPALGFITAPIDRQLQAYHDRRMSDLAQRLEEGDARLSAADEPREFDLEVKKNEGWQPMRVRVRPVSFALATGAGHQALPRRPSLSALTVTEPFTVYFKVSIYCGFILSSPWIFYQLWSFVAAGLYRHEKRLVHLFVPLSVGLFLAGVALCEFVVLPVGVGYLLGYYEWLGVEPELRLNDWLSFAIFMPLVFGLCFQTPLAMLAAARLGIVNVEGFRKHRRIAIFALVFVAAVVTPTPDAVNLAALAVPLWLLFEFGIVLCRLMPGRPAEEDVEADAAEAFV